jgi:hypothetical protein
MRVLHEHICHQNTIADKKSRTKDSEEGGEMSDDELEDEDDEELDDDEDEEEREGEGDDDGVRVIGSRREDDDDYDLQEDSDLVKGFVRSKKTNKKKST